jgi:NAD(P)-dependent dehydrogenase (short-subunit alcohol dehydrogenase family)
MDDALDFTGKVVLVTGGTRGIGRAIAAGFAAAGAQVVVCGRRQPDGATEGAREDAPDGATEGAQDGATEGARDGPPRGATDAAPGGPPAGAPAFVGCDVREPEQVDRLVGHIVDSYGRLDVVVNNAGGGPVAPAATASPRFSEAVIRLNLLAPMHVSQAANRVMQGQPAGGSIVNIASLSGVRPSPGTAAYGAAKAGLLSLTKSLAIEWAPKVRVNAIVAGMVLTDEARPHYGGDEAIARVAATVPLGRMAEPDDLAGACLFLASPLAAYVSGATLEVHGGGEPPPFLAAVDDRQA